MPMTIIPAGRKPETTSEDRISQGVREAAQLSPPRTVTAFSPKTIKEPRK
jgi:hypothetical protein